MKIKILLLVLATLTLQANLLLAETSFDTVRNKISEKTSIQYLDLREEQGRVVLEGRAGTLKDKMEAEKIAKDKLKKDVVNNIILADSQKTDREITLDVVAKIQHKSARSYLYNTLAVDTKGGNVILSGKVRDAVFSNIAEEAAMEVPGVRSIENKIEILPVSAGDDRLRILISSRFSSDTHLQKYFLGPQPSISIIVENARVILIGIVNTQGDHSRAAILARGVSGVLSVDNQLQVE